MNAPAELIQKVTRLPKQPGVYLMRDVAGEVIYVGKAKELRARVRSYFRGGDGRVQVEYLVSRIADIETIVTSNERQALVLERDLITKYKPRYNIRLKDDKAYLSIRVDVNAEWPRLELVRKRHQDGARYFGPFSFSYELRTLLDVIKRVVPLRTCADAVFHNRTRPCLEYQIKRCSGPCCLPVAPDQYREWVSTALQILEGKVQPVLEVLERKMETLAENLMFEEAAAMRDRIKVLSEWRQGASIVSSRDEDKDIVGFFREDLLAVVSILRFRQGRVSDSANFSFEAAAVDDGELLQSVISQFYGPGKDIPPEIVVPLQLETPGVLEEVLTEVRGKKVSLVIPERGLRARLLGLATINAKEHFLGVFDTERRYREVAEKLAQICELRQVPRRIECVDISNLQGSDIVGAIVAFQDGEPDKSAYRKYKIKSVTDTPNDFASIFEVVTRRLQDGRELPDLMLIDGGAAQLQQALAARDALGVPVEIVSVAKSRLVSATQDAPMYSPERLFVPGDPTPRSLDPAWEVSKFVTRIRDEVHRFVITFHRATRSARVVSSALDRIPGLGPERRRRILKHYGDIAAVAAAAPEDLARVGRMPKSLALKVLRVLQQGG